MRAVAGAASSASSASGGLADPSGFVGDDGHVILLAKDAGSQVHLQVGKSPSSVPAPVESPAPFP